MFFLNSQKNKRDERETQRGFTLLEVIISVAILSLIVGIVGALQADVFSLNRIIQSGLKNQSDAKKIVKPFANEVRGATVSNLGAYPISESTSNSFSFYSDIDSDGLREKVSYFLEDGYFKKGVIKPTGQPLVYDPEDQKIISVIEDIVSEDIFEYYGSDYDGTASSTPLSEPVTTSDIRLIKITLTIDSNPLKPPDAIEITTQASIRNLKDNL